MDYRKLISAAIQAPSSHNTQPWLFRISEDAIEVIADRTRALAVNDPLDRELTISCGAALLNLRAAAAAMNMGVCTTICPKGSPELLADVALSADCLVESSLAKLAPAIGSRFSTRGKMFGNVPQGLCDQLVQAARCEDAELHFVEMEHRSPIAEFIAEGDRRQFSNPHWRHELASWMRSRRKDDGLAQSSWSSPVMRLVVRYFDLGKGVGRNDRKLAMEAPLLAVLTTPDDNKPAWLRCGQALQRVLLVAAGEGIYAGYLNQPCQVEDLRLKFRRQIGGTGYPQLVFRLGYSEEPAHRTHRRDVEDVVILPSNRRALR